MNDKVVCSETARAWRHVIFISFFVAMYGLYLFIAVRFELLIEVAELLSYMIAVPVVIIEVVVIGRLILKQREVQAEIN